MNKTLDQLKVLWKDCKAKAKKAMPRDKRERIKTGGGNKDYEIDGMTKVIFEMIPQFQNQIVLGILHQSKCQRDLSYHELHVQ